MAENKICACTGIRHCLRCEKKADNSGSIKYNTFVCCYLCGEIKPQQEIIICTRRPPLQRCTNDCSKGVTFININQELSPNIETISVYKEFLSAKEETEVVKEVDSFQWIPSQSGRNKQVRINIRWHDNSLTELDLGFWAKGKL